MSPGGIGDCEDFALTKMQMLVDTYGWNPNNLCMVTAFSKNGEYHAMLGVRTRNRGLVVLDVNYDEVMESGRVPYRIDKIALSSDDWRNYTRRLDSVPIEYMTCNAGAFADGDRVVVEFTSQKWAQPKVIGFIENPQSCDLELVNCLGRNGTPEAGEASFLTYYVNTDTWYGGENIPGDYYNGEKWTGDPFYPQYTIRDNFFCSQDSSAVFIFGGIGLYQTLYDADMYLSRADRRDNTVNTWTELQSVPARRSQGQGFMVGGGHYVVSGAENNHTEISGGYEVAKFGAVFTDNYKYSYQANSWTNKTAATYGGHQNKSFVIDGIAFFLLGYGTEVWGPGSHNGDPFPRRYMPASYMPDIVIGYNHASDAWAAYQSQLRGGAGRGATNIFGDGYVGPGVCSGDYRDGDNDTNYVYPGMYEPGHPDYEPPQVLFYGWMSDYIDKYQKASDTWSILMRENDGNEREYTNMTGGFNGASYTGYGVLCNGFKSITPNTATLTTRASLDNLSRGIETESMVGF